MGTNVFEELFVNDIIRVLQLVLWLLSHDLLVHHNLIIALLIMLSEAIR